MISQHYQIIKTILKSKFNYIFLLKLSFYLIRIKIIYNQVIY